MSDILAIDLIRALWEDARREADPERKAQLERDAAAMEDVWKRSKYALAPTRDQMTAALGNASLNLADTLAAVASGQRQVDARVGEIHEYVQQNNTLFSTFFETFPPQFTAFQDEMRAAAQESSTRLGKLETGQAGLATQFNDLSERVSEIDARDQQQYLDSEKDRRAIHDELAAIRQYMAGNRRAELDAMQAQLAEIQGPYSPDERARLTGILLRMIAEWEQAHGDA